MRAFALDTWGLHYYFHSKVIFFVLKSFAQIEIYIIGFKYVYVSARQPLSIICMFKE